VITPPVGGARRFDGLRNVVRLLLFALAAALSAAVVGVACAYLGSLVSGIVSRLSTALWLSVGVCAAAYGLAELCGARWWVPSREWLIPRRWGRWGSPVFDILFGLFLGAGFFTINRFIGYHVLLLVCMLSRDPVKAAVLMGTFGATRAIPILALPLIGFLKHRQYDFTAAYDMHKHFTHLDRNLQSLRATVLLVIFGISLTAVLTV
jgi:hypothetical protein